MVYLFMLAVGFLTGVFSVCLVLAFFERDCRRAGDVIDLTGYRMPPLSDDERARLRESWNRYSP